MKIALKATFIATLFFSFSSLAQDSSESSSETSRTPTVEQEQIIAELNNFCKDSRDKTYSLGAKIVDSNETFRCVMTYGDNNFKTPKLAWVQLSAKNEEILQVPEDEY